MELLRFKEFLNERLEVKRKYTSIHPSISRNEMTKVRNMVLTYIADQIVTEEELLNIIKRAGSQNVKSWLKQNGEYFKLVKGNLNTPYFKLTPRALRLLNGLN